MICFPEENDIDFLCDDKSTYETGVFPKQCAIEPASKGLPNCLPVLQEFGGWESDEALHMQACFMDLHGVGMIDLGLLHSVSFVR